MTKTAEKFEEVEVLEAEVIESSIEKIEFTPAVIDAASYLKAKGDYVRQMMRPYEDMDDEAIAAMDLAEAKVCRADLNRLVKEVEDERKAIKKAYDAPLKAFEDAVSAILEPARDGERRLKQYIDDQVSIQRDLKRMSLEQSYEIYAPALVPVVPFDLIMQKTNPKWLNKSYNGVKATEELEAAVNRIAKDWETLKGSKDALAFYDEAEAEFFRTLDLGAALELNKRRVEEKQRIDQLKADVEQNAAAQQPKPAEEPEPEPEPFVAVDIRKSYVIRIDLSDFEKTRLLDFIKQERIGANRTIGRAM